MPSARRAATVLVGLALFALAAGILLAGQHRSSGSGAPPAAGPPPAATATVFMPVEADGDDVSSGVVIQSRTVPGFQFQDGGTLLAGQVRDAATGRPVAGATLWLTLVPAAFGPAAPILRTTTDKAGRYAMPHLAAASYVLAAARPVGRRSGSYALQTRRVAIDGQPAVRADLALQALPPGPPGPSRRGARNVIVVELNGIYARSLLDDRGIEAPTIRRLARTGYMAISAWADYGWPAMDDLLLATGSYPSWRDFDPWPHLVPWGTQDGIDLAPWYQVQHQDGAGVGPPAVQWGEYWGQDSVFDVARRAGLATGWLGTAERQPLHVNPDALTYAGTLGPASGWMDDVAGALNRLTSAPRGFLLYIDLAPPSPPQGEQQPSPAAAGGRYAQTAGLYDALVAGLIERLAAMGHGADTRLVLTAGEAQVGHALVDNYFGMGSSGRGTSLQIPLIVHGPGIPAGRAWTQPVPADAIAPTVTSLLGLPAPAGARSAPLPLGGP